MSSNIIDLESPQEKERKQLNAQVTENEDFSSSIINSSLDGIVTYDREFRFTLWNLAAEKMTGLRKSEALGRCAFDLFPEILGSHREEAFRNSLIGKTTDSAKLAVVDKVTRQTRYLVASHSPLRDELGFIVGGLSMLRDATEDHWATQQIQDLNSSLETRVQERTDLLEHAVQDLRQEILGRLRTESNLKFLTNSGEILAATLDYAQTVQAVRELASCHFQGYCILQLNEESPTTAVLAVGPEEVRIAAKPKLPTELLALDLKSSLNVPLSTGGQISGRLTIVSSNRVYTDLDLKTAEELGRRASIALENSLLFSRTQAQLR